MRCLKHKTIGKTSHQVPQMKSSCGSVSSHGQRKGGLSVHKVLLKRQTCSCLFLLIKKRRTGLRRVKRQKCYTKRSLMCALPTNKGGRKCVHVLSMPFFCVKVKRTNIWYTICSAKGESNAPPVRVL